MKRILFVCTYLLLFGCIASAKSVNLGLKIEFDSGMSTVYYQDYATVERLAKLQQLSSRSKVLIAGHTDSIGSETVNQELSEARAKSVKNLLIKYGVDATRIETKGFSENSPIADNNTKEGRTQNRRVVATIYNLDQKELNNLLNDTEKSDLFNVIAPENEQVEAFVKEELESTDGETVEQVSNLQQVELLESTPEKPPQSFETNKSKIFEGSRYYLGLGLYQNVLEADDNIGPGVTVDAEWVSKLHFDIMAAYQFKIREHLWIGLEGEVHIQDYAIELDTPYVWDEKNPTLFGLALTTDYEKNIWGLGFDLRYKNEAFVFENNDDVTLRAPFLLSVKLRGKYKFYDSTKYSSRFGVSIEHGVLGSGFLEPEGRLGLMAYVDLSKKNWFENHEVNFRLYYGLRDFKNNENDQNEELGGFQIGYRNKRWL